MYHVGFGDCFLLTFHYSSVDRHLLIDFGSTRQTKTYMKAVAKDIQSRCGGKLDALLATHRHKDHLSGFQTDPDPTKISSGGIIADLKPDLVSMTWTEDPKLDVDALGPEKSQDQLSFVYSLKQMQSLAEIAGQAAESARKRRSYRLANELGNLAEINIANKSALANLLTMADTESTEFLHYGSKTALNAMFRGVRFHVLGPPTVEQSLGVKSQVSRDVDEYWHLANYWRFMHASYQHGGGSESPFPKYVERRLPDHARWLIDRTTDPTHTDLLRISRVMDRAINNTSVILLIELWGTKLLFPGDAQIESWDYVLNGPDGAKNRKLLTDIYVYKVGHHASLNGTPKSLWNLFQYRKDRSPSTPMYALLSSRIDIHGHRDNGTEVPRSKLIDALESGSELIASRWDIPKTEKITDLEFSDLEINFV
tara:strand:- start:448 stop:1722 length:1275 start_codon:yes stop_codon:yes gene_type:complete